jgi:hypothetical protein
MQAGLTYQTQQHLAFALFFKKKKLMFFFNSFFSKFMN